MIAGSINGFIVTVLRVNPIIATLGTLAAFGGIAFLLAPEGKPIGVLTQPAFTWLAQGRFLTDAADSAARRLEVDRHSRADGDPRGRGASSSTSS